MAGRRRRRPSRKADSPGWVWMLGGLAVGLSVALWVYIQDRKPGAIPARAIPAVKAPAPKEPVKSTQADEEDDGFDFYKMLPRFEVVIPERERSAAPDSRAAAIDEPGTYVLQAGSFQTYADADRRKAELALYGIQSRIQRVTIDEDEWHRVRIGPVEDLAELNDLRATLRNAEIEVMLIRVGD